MPATLVLATGVMVSGSVLERSQANKPCFSGLRGSVLSLHVRESHEWHGLRSHSSMVTKCSNCPAILPRKIVPPTHDIANPIVALIDMPKSLSTNMTTVPEDMSADSSSAVQVRNRRSTKACDQCAAQRARCNGQARW